MTISILVGGLVFAASWLDATLAGGWTAARLGKALFYSMNTTAVAFWIILVLYYFTTIRLGPAALDWERRLRLAEEIFQREAARGRGSWWM
jgi:hypothetical protein